MRKNTFIKKTHPLIFNGIAHRGLHNKIDICENGMLAFSSAIKEGVPIELDVHLTKDNHLVVCHDSELFRTTNKKGIIEELSLKEIQDKYLLSDGGKIPTIEEVLDLVKEKVPLVIELKTYKKNNLPLAKKLIEVLENRIINPSNYMAIAFDPRALFPLKKLHILRVLLVARERYDVFFFRHFFDGVDIEDKLLNKKKVIRYSKRHFTNVWTIENKDEILKMPSSIDTITYQYIKPSVACNLLNELKKERTILKKEISYGGVIYKKENGKILFLTEKMKLGHVSLCKGHYELGETPYQTALREIKEETNQDVIIDPKFREIISYYPNKNVYKDVIFFLAKIKSEKELVDNHDDEVLSSKFLPYKEARKELTHKSDKKVLKKAYQYLSKNAKN